MERDDLLGFRELTALLGVGRSTAARYVDRHDFPTPVAELASGRIWTRPDVETWAKQHLPAKRGRPKSDPTAG